jgi:hypothetical protein
MFSFAIKGRWVINQGLTNGFASCRQPPAERTDCLRQQNATKRNSVLVRIFISKAIKFLIAVLLTPVLPPLFVAIWKQGTTLDPHLLYLENPACYCLTGLILWGLFALLFHLPPRAYVIAHEFTHALFITLCGGSVKKISVGRNSGYVLSDRSNFLVTLAPYLFPFYAFAWSLICLAVIFIWHPPHAEKVFWIGLGVGLGYHWSMTGRMLMTQQSDFSSQGYLFSFVLIILTNGIFLLGALMLLPSPHGFPGRATAFLHAIAHSYQTLIQLISRW